LSRRRLAIGGAAVLLYLSGWAVTARLGATPVLWLDGLLPPAPYNWVKPPPELRATNLAPTSGAGTVGMRGGVFEPGFVSTDDGQASLSIVPGTFPAHGSDRDIRISITPEGAAAFPAQLTPHGNFYRITATYLPSGTLAQPPFTQLPLVTLRYPRHRADETVYVSASGKGPWDRLTCSLQTVIQDLVCRTSTLGWFVVAYPTAAQPFTLPLWVPAAVAAAGLGGLAIFGLLRAQRHPRQRRPRR